MILMTWANNCNNFFAEKHANLCVIYRLYNPTASSFLQRSERRTELLNTSPNITCIMFQDAQNPIQLISSAF